MKLQNVQIVPIDQFCDLQITQNMINTLFFCDYFLLVIDKNRLKTVQNNLK